jgi:hypothetical protein
MNEIQVLLVNNQAELRAGLRRLIVSQYAVGHGDPRGRQAGHRTDGG